MVHNFIEATLSIRSCCVWTNCFLGMYIKTYQSMFWVARSTADHVTTYHNRQKQPKSMFSVQHYNKESLLKFHLDGSKQHIAINIFLPSAVN